MSGPSFSASLPNGIASGDTTQTSTVLWARAAAPGTIRFEWSTDAAFGTVAGSATATVVDPTLPVKATVAGLQSGTEYFYRVTAPDLTTLIGTFDTPAALGQFTGLTFGITGDWRGGEKPYPAVSNADERNLDFFVEFGDTIYADVPSDIFPSAQALTLADFRAKHSEVYSADTGFNTLADLRASTTIFATIDDHEVTDNFEGGAPPTPFGQTQANGRPSPFLGSATRQSESDLYKNGLQAFTEYNPIVPLTYSGTGDPRFDGKPDLYRSQSFGSDAAMFVPDLRTFRDKELSSADPRDPADVARFMAESFDASRTLVGRTQMERLKADILAADQSGVIWKFVNVAEPIQNLGVTGAGDRFEGYLAERTELLKFIDDNNIANVVFVTADIHGTLVNNLTYQERLGGPQIALGSFEISTGAVAFDPNLGPSIIMEAANAGFITPQQAAFYAAQPVAPDPDSNPNDKDDVVKAVINNQLDAFGYDRMGLNDNLAIANGLVKATLLQGDYVAAHTFGWTEFKIDATTHKLLVTTFGVATYNEGEAAADPAGIAARAPTIVSQFEVDPNRAPAIDSRGGTATAALVVDENTTAVTTVAATDPDGTIPTFELAGGADVAKFTINPTTGALAFAVAPDFEAPADANRDNVYDVTVRATDRISVDDQRLFITVANVDEAPPPGAPPITPGAPPMGTPRDGVPLVDDGFYLSRYPDVARAGVDPDDHYFAFGAREGRDPSAFFSTNGYLSANPDVRAAGINPLTHYLQFGAREGRDPSAAFDDELYLQAYPDVARDGSNPLAHFLAYGQAEGRSTFVTAGSRIDVRDNGFDREFYLLANPDVGLSGADAFGHYSQFGFREGRAPNAFFDTQAYLTAYGDVRSAGVNPIDHYHAFGFKEGRDPSGRFDTSSYLDANPDVRAAGVDPLVHFLEFGRAEGRSAFADGTLLS